RRRPHPGGFMNESQWLYAVGSLAKANNIQVALLVDNYQVVAIGLAANATGIDTAVVNVLQNHTALLSNPTIYASYPVTDMCWGMAWARGIPVYYLTGVQGPQGKTLGAATKPRTGEEQRFDVVCGQSRVEDPAALVQGKPIYKSRLTKPEVAQILGSLPR